MTFSICSADPTAIYVQFWINIPLILSSFTSSLALEAALDE